MFPMRKRSWRNNVSMHHLMGDVRVNRALFTAPTRKIARNDSRKIALFAAGKHFFGKV